LDIVGCMILNAIKIGLVILGSQVAPLRMMKSPRKIK